MKTGKTKFLLAIGLTLGVVSLGVALFGQDGGISNTLFTLRATGGVEMGSIVFNKSNSVKSGTTNTTTASTQTGGTVICKTFSNNAGSSSGYIGSMLSGSTIRFFESDGTTEYTFEDLEKIIINKDSTSFSFAVHGQYDNGTAFSFDYNANYNAKRTVNFHDYGNVANLYVETTSNNSTLINSIEIVYNCNHKSLSGVEVSTEPTKMSYTEGESFDPSGMIVKAVYSNGSKVATSSYTYYPTGALTLDDTSITITHLGVSTTLVIEVEEAAQIDITGTYNGSYINSNSVLFNLTLTFNANGSGTFVSIRDYDDFQNSSASFTWTYQAGVLTLTKTEQTVQQGIRMYTNSGGTSTSNSTGLFSENILTISLYTSQYSSSSTSITFTKA